MTYKNESKTTSAGLWVTAAQHGGCAVEGGCVLCVGYVKAMWYVLQHPCCNQPQDNYNKNDSSGAFEEQYKRLLDDIQVRSSVHACGHYGQRLPDALFQMNGSDARGLRERMHPQRMH